MATKQDFTDAEWETLQKGITGSGMLVSLSERGFTDTFGEAGAMGKYLAGQQVAGPTDLVRALVHVRGTGFGLIAAPDRVRDETMAALRASVELLQAKAPDELDAYRAVVVGVAQAVADAKGGTAEAEASVIGQIREALGTG